MGANEQFPSLHPYQSPLNVGQMNVTTDEFFQMSSMLPVPIEPVAHYYQLRLSD